MRVSTATIGGQIVLQRTDVVCVVDPVPGFRSVFPLATLAEQGLLRSATDMPVDFMRHVASLVGRPS